MASSQSFSMIQRRISLSPEPAPPVNSGEPLKTMAMRLPPWSPVDSPGFIFESMCSRNSSEPSFLRGRPAPKRPAMPWFSCSSLTSRAAFQSTPKGGLESR
jgi:hypothetical protein